MFFNLCGILIYSTGVTQNMEKSTYKESLITVYSA